MLNGVRRALVIAPHMDDEVLGCGGTIARLATVGAQVDVAIVTIGQPPRFLEAEERQCMAEAEQAHAIIGVTRTHHIALPAAELDTRPRIELEQAIGAVIAEVAPDLLLLPFGGDIHRDHQLVFEAGITAARDTGGARPPRIWTYETLSETNWNAPYVTPGFVPTVHVDIEATLERKLSAMGAYQSQLKTFPSERSLDAITALARLRGAGVHRPAAEAFVAIREVL